MSKENVEIVRSISDAWNRGDYSTASELVDPEVLVEADIGGMLDGTFRGMAGLTKWLADFWGNFEVFRTEIGEYIPIGDEVLFAAHHYGRGKGSGVEVEMHNWQICTVRDGRIVRYRIFKTKRQALEAVGLTE